jgi:hypothetical protein
MGWRSTAGSRRGAYTFFKGERNAQPPRSNLNPLVTESPAK